MNCKFFLLCLYLVRIDNGVKLDPWSKFWSVPSVSSSSSSSSSSSFSFSSILSSLSSSSVKKACLEPYFWKCGRIVLLIHISMDTIFFKLEGLLLFQFPHLSLLYLVFSTSSWFNFDGLIKSEINLFLLGSPIYWNPVL